MTINRMRESEITRGASNSGATVADAEFDPMLDAAQASEPTLGDLFTGLTTDLTTLVRKEIQLAKTEIMENISHATRSVVLMAAGGLLAYAGLITLIIAVAVALGNIMPFWLATLIVALLVIIIGAMLIQSGRSMLKHMSLVPQKSIESIKQDAEMVKEQVRS